MYCFYGQGQHLLDFRVMLSIVSQHYAERIAPAPTGWGLPKVKTYKPISIPFFPCSQQELCSFFYFLASDSASSGWRLTSFQRGCWTSPRLLHFAFGGAGAEGHSALFQGWGPDLCSCPPDNARLCSSSKASLLSRAVPKELGKVR